MRSRHPRLLAAVSVAVRLPEPALLDEALERAGRGLRGLATEG